MRVTDAILSCRSITSTRIFTLLVCVRWPLPKSRSSKSAQLTGTISVCCSDFKGKKARELSTILFEEMIILLLGVLSLFSFIVNPGFDVKAVIFKDGSHARFYSFGEKNWCQHHLHLHSLAHVLGLVSLIIFTWWCA